MYFYFLLFAVIKCPSPPEVDHGYVAENPGNTTAYGAVIVYKCDNNATMMGDPRVTCLHNKTWSTPPECLCKYISLSG